MRDCKRIAFGVMETVDSIDAFPLKVKITLAKTGVLEYVRSDGTITREAKLPEDLFHADTIASIKGAPITMEHPAGLVSPANADELVKGSIMDSVKEKDGKLIGNGVIYNQELINRIKSGDKKEVSIGFTHRLEEKAGEIDGEKYDFIQRSILVNHVAATDSGRAGPEVAIHLDSNQNIAIQKNDSVTRELDNMKKITLKLDEGIIKKLADLGTLLKSKDNEHIEQATEKIAEVANELQAAVSETPLANGGEAGTTEIPDSETPDPVAEAPEPAPADPAAPQKGLRLADVMQITHLSRTSIFRKIRDGSFPQPLDLGKGAPLVWLESQRSALEHERASAAETPNAEVA